MKGKSGWLATWLLCLLPAAATFFFSYRFAETYLFANLENLIAIGTILPTAFIFLFSGTIALCVGLLVFQLIRKHFYKKIIHFYYIIYFIILIWSLLFKSPGMSGYNFDLSDIVMQFYAQPEILLANQLIFIPLGFFVALKGFKFKRTVLISFIFSLVIESIQIIFKLGLFDVIDIITNTTGALIGFLLAQELLHHFTWTYNGRYISINKISAILDEHKIVLFIRRVILIAWLIQVCILVFSFLQAPPYEKTNAFIPTGSLHSLDKLSKTESGLKNNSGSDIPVLQENTVKFEGFCELSDSWKDTNAHKHWGISLIMIDKKSQNSAVIVPLVLSSNDEVAKTPDAKELIASSQVQKATITARIENGWFEITSVQLSNNLPINSDIDIQLLQEEFPWQYYGEIEMNLKKQTSSTKKIGYISSFTQTDEKTFISVCTYEHLYNVPIIQLHNINVESDWTADGKDLGSPEYPISFDKEFEKNLL
ncbi:VanZ family protein [uncultured Olegusella sp.]|uniref:VanZ family protein n=1 Tax=uncultured Olegusella sp. TaxID=1979846 RepID=UPI002623202C|nr:VanZ family protein [uncultured Olegusella sp.]